MTRDLVGAYATEDNASLAKMGSASFFGRRVSWRRSLLIFRPSRTRLRTEPVATEVTLFLDRMTARRGRRAV